MITSLKKKNNLAAMSSADIIIGTTNGKAVIDKTVLSKVKSKPIIVDVGKGTVFKDALIYAIRKKILLINTESKS